MRRLLALVAAALVACGPAGSRSEPWPTPTAAVTSAPPTVAATTTPASPTPLAALLTKTLRDVRSGDEFTLGQFSGRITLVQHMAIW